MILSRQKYLRTVDSAFQVRFIPQEGKLKNSVNSIFFYRKHYMDEKTLYISMYKRPRVHWVDFILLDIQTPTIDELLNKLHRCTASV